MAKQIKTYLEQIKKKVASMRKKWKYRQKLLAGNAFRLASDLTEDVRPPKEQSRVPNINFAPLENAVAHLMRSAAAYDSALTVQMNKGITLSKDELVRLNNILQLPGVREAIEQRKWEFAKVRNRYDAPLF